MTGRLSSDMPSMTLTCCICNQAMQRTKTSRPQGQASHAKCREAHGTPGFYSRGCRCGTCKAGQAARMREYNAQKRHDSGKVAPPCTLCGVPIARHSQSPRPFHKACKNRAPLWLRMGRPDPSIARAQAALDRAEKKAQPKRDLRSPIRAAYEGSDWEALLAAIKAATVVTRDGCWEWQRRIKDGYGTVQIAGRVHQVHRLSLQAKHGRPLGVLAAHHKCANSKCANPDHLQPVTHRENVAEMLARTSLEARIHELEGVLAELSPNHPVLNRLSHLTAA